MSFLQRLYDSLDQVDAGDEVSNGDTKWKGLVMWNRPRAKYACGNTVRGSLGAAPNIYTSLACDATWWCKGSAKLSLALLRAFTNGCWTRQMNRVSYELRLSGKPQVG